MRRYVFATYSFWLGPIGEQSVTKLLGIPIVLAIVVVCAPQVFAFDHETRRESAVIAARQTERASSSTQSDLRPQLDKIVESYRKIIVLLDDESTLSDEERNRCVYVARQIHQLKQDLLDALESNLTGDLRQAAANRFRDKPLGVGVFTDYISGSALRSIDRLAFIDLADELLSVVTEQERAANLSRSPVHSTLQRINDD